jgi:hypothetical protein
VVIKENGMFEVSIPLLKMEASAWMF